ncbi:hypothetical protein EV663_1229 [Rhodovulum bhavnagarense]|uniref:Uncharacterized protein n=1 Tax=Rhodovulum bhavnagarense TaxID=992286 RepID=A0A4R2R7F2_9RHOB|nr:hypothetical protein [Rhodovulum bhavnagarense]TCP58533.1 hypothetical protein EV663_1229 [Rhodovulum bhavnagarense]
MNATPEAQTDENTEEALARDVPVGDAGFIKFYGLYWRKDLVDWSSKHILGQPKGWLGKGRIAANFDRQKLQMNFWGQKGVYVLYDDALHPVYAGQAGLTRKDSAGGQAIGDRLNMHRQGVYRNGWSLFSWFGFLETEKLNLKKVKEDEKRLSPKWEFKPQEQSELNLLLASFEAILIEGFAPRFNARGGDLKTAVLVNQYEPHANEISTN